jgi:hypothetical protein
VINFAHFPKLFDRLMERKQPRRAGTRGHVIERRKRRFDVDCAIARNYGLPRNSTGTFWGNPNVTVPQAKLPEQYFQVLQNDNDKSGIEQVL